MSEPPHLRAARRPRVGGEGDPDVICIDEQTDVPIDLARWRSLALAALLDEGVRGLTELSLLFVDAADIAELNHVHMGVDGPTDVLAFPIDANELVVLVDASGPSRGPGRAPVDPSDFPLLLGDVVVCPAVAAEQAPEHAGTLDDELALLVVHGVLHVLGHDHAEPEETVTMRRREREILERHHWHGPAPATFRQEQA
jgi:probable rRNA maturation factor